MKKSLILLAVLGLSIGAFAFEYSPKNTDTNPFGKGIINKTDDSVLNTQKSAQAAQPEMREIRNLTEYFRYLPAEVHRHWTPYKADTDYEVAYRQPGR